MYSFLQKLFADGGYQGPEFQKTLVSVKRTANSLGDDAGSSSASSS
jgi:hypothetical protein